MMVGYAWVTKYKFPDSEFIICLGIEPGISRSRRSEDLMSFDFRKWKEEDNKAAQKIQEEMDILTDVDERHLSEPPNIRRGDLHSGNRKERRKMRAVKRSNIKR